MDFVLRTGKTANSLNKTKDDNNSTKLIVLTFAIILITAELLSYFRIGLFQSRKISFIALGFMVIGLLIRIYSMLKLKASYTRILLKTDQQKLISTGLYGIIRHPGYLGTILIWIFFGFAINNYFVAAISIFLILATYAYRINAEEKMLSEQFGPEYKNYQKQTWKVIPFIW